MPDFVICLRNVKTKGARKEFGAEPGKTRFLQVPSNHYPQPSHEIAKSDWVKKVMARAKCGVNHQTGNPCGDILVFIHGYNSDQKIVLKRQRKLTADLEGVDFQGAVVAFDWPSDDMALNYLEDRDDAKHTATRLRDDCIKLFCDTRTDDCEINVHLLAHSTGAYVVREAFTYADEKRELKNDPWKVSQICLIGADISANSLSSSDARARSIYRHCVRLTNYENPFDGILKLSNTKRIGLSPRVGRVGLPATIPHNAVNVSCADYFDSLDEDDLIAGEDYFGSFDHSWHIGNPVFTRDLLFTMHGEIDRGAIPTRKVVDGELILWPTAE